MATTVVAISDAEGVAPDRRSAHHEGVSQSAMGDDDYEEWRDLREVLEDRDAEWWADHDPDEEG